MGATSPLSKAQEARVRQQLLNERRAARSNLAAAKRQLPKAAADHARATKAEAKAWQRHAPYEDAPAGSQHPTYAAWQAASEEAARAAAAWMRAYDLVRSCEHQVQELYDPATLAARLEQRAANEARFAHLRARAS